VTESRISQLRSEALVMLRDGIEAQYDPSSEPAATGRVARRKAGYASAISDASHWHDRVSEHDTISV
jgi:RNA polymerase sigma factor for flagellar operon FliA